jgi:hypothetical protein
MRKRRRLLGLLVVGALFGWSPPERPRAHASQEGILVWSAFSIESLGIGSSGPVSISGKQDRTGPTAVTVKAFGRTYLLAKDHLQKLEGVMMNGMQLSYEGGYKELGGRTLYIQLLRGFTSGVPLRRTIEIRERGDIVVQESPSK